MEYNSKELQHTVSAYINSICWYFYIPVSLGKWRSHAFRQYTRSHGQAIKAAATKLAKQASKYKLSIKVVSLDAWVMCDNQLANRRGRGSKKPYMKIMRTGCGQEEPGSIIAMKKSPVIAHIKASFLLKIWTVCACVSTALDEEYTFPQESWLCKCIGRTIFPWEFS